MQTAVKFWDNIADRYAKSPIRDMEAYEYSLGRTISYLGAKDRVLELGSGTGSTALRLAPHVARYTVNDISPRMIEIGEAKAAEAGATNLDFVAGEITAPSISGNEYDTVMALNLLHLLKDAPGAVRHIHSLVKPGGLFISKTVTTFGAGVPWKMRLLKLALPIMQMLGKAPFVQFMTTEELEGIITDAGFKIIETGNYPASPPSRYIVARKEG
jgi:ubiquinone/menaquinone biosynthesis C-methylase UbiE